MCRGFQQSESERVLKMKTFNIKFSVVETPISSTSTFPDSLTLYYLPRINGTPLEINHSKIKPNSPAFITLHRVIDSCSTQVVCFSTRERVKASQGARFEVYLGDVRIIKGFFTKDYLNDAWKMECACGLECGRKLQEAVKEVEVQVAAEGGVEMSEMVEMVVKRRRRRAVESGMLEEIPEETEDINDNNCVCDCWRCEEIEEEEVDDDESDGGDMVVVDEVSWAVDVGIWVMCLGVGLLVSRASSRRLVRYTNKFL